jgi:hypothetical protein
VKALRPGGPYLTLVLGSFSPVPRKQDLLGLRTRDPGFQPHFHDPHGGGDGRRNVWVRSTNRDWGPDCWHKAVWTGLSLS